MPSSSPELGATASSLDAQRPSKVRTTWLVPLLGSAALLVGLGWLVDWRELSHILLHAHWPTLGAAACVFAGTILLRGARFTALLNRLADTPQTRRVGFELASLNNLANHVLPFRLGELVFVFLATFAHQIKAERAVVTLLTARLYDLVTLALLVAVHAPFVSQAQSSRVLVGLTLVVVAVLIVAIRLDWLLRMARLIASPLRHWAPKKVSKLDTTLTRLEQNLGALRTPSLIATNLMLGLAIWSSLNLFFWLVLHGLGFALTWPQVVLGAAATGLSALLPINTIGSIGTLEAGWVLGFVWVGLPARHAVSSSLVMHVIVIVISALIAVPHALRLGPATLGNFMEWQRHARGH